MKISKLIEVQAENKELKLHCQHLKRTAEQLKVTLASTKTSIFRAYDMMLCAQNSEAIDELAKLLETEVDQVPYVAENKLNRVTQKSN